MFLWQSPLRERGTTTVDKNELHLKWFMLNITSHNNSLVWEQSGQVHTAGGRITPQTQPHLAFPLSLNSTPRLWHFCCSNSKSVREVGGGFLTIYHVFIRQPVWIHMTASNRTYPPGDAIKKNLSLLFILYFYLSHLSFNPLLPILLLESECIFAPTCFSPD